MLETAWVDHEPGAPSDTSSRHLLLLLETSGLAGEALRCNVKHLARSAIMGPQGWQRHRA